MENEAIRENFIPFRRSDVLEMCIRDDRLSADETKEFRRLCQFLASVFHFEFHEKLEQLKDAYAPFDPDSDAQVLDDLSDEEVEKRKRILVAGLEALLEAGNYIRVTEEDLERAMVEESLFKIRLHVDFDDFDEVIFYSRGERVNQETLTKFFGLSSQQIDVPTFDRVAVYVKFKDASYFASKNRRSGLIRPGSTILKLFRNIPKADLEMLFPNSDVRMKPLDKALIGVPALAGGIPIVLKVAFSFGVIGALFAYAFGQRKEPPNTAELTAMLVAAGALGGFVFKQWTNFKNRKMMFMKLLGDNLYFKNLDNNAGVFHRLVDSAEEEECKEAFLAYFFLLTAERGLSQTELDELIEAWFESKWDTVLDFEVDDALDKLQRLGLASEVNGLWSVTSLADANRHLRATWENCLNEDGPERLEDAAST